MVKKLSEKSVWFYRLMVYIAPAILFFSYYPLIHFGSNATMNFEISLPLIWLVVFDVWSFAMLARRGKLNEILKKWQWLLLPIFLTLSVFWSLNFLRGLLTVGILWLIYFAAFSLYSFRDLLSGVQIKERIIKSLLYSGLVICAWCLLQCILDLFGVSREYSLMCAGCVTDMFGFPHPNGFAVEPQFMGNLLLAPTIVSGWLMFSSRSRSARYYAVLFFIFTAVLFLTFSRGAIYSFGVALMFMTTLQIIHTKKWRALLAWPVVILAFIFTLNLQGIFAEISPTNENYGEGIARVLNHLSLGVIDVRANRNTVDKPDVSDSESTKNNIKKDEAIFDGYVESSTDTRLGLSSRAIKIWSKDIPTMLFGVGVGGAGEALYINKLLYSPKEIIQNQYVSLLLEVGMIGVVLLVFSLWLVFRAVIKSDLFVPVLSLILAYGVSLCFFAGLPNALHIYLLPVILLCGKN